MPYRDIPLPPQPYGVGYASGCFDLFHVGHLRFLQQAAEHCRQLIVGVPVDAIVGDASNKGRPPIFSVEQRLEVIAALRCVARAVAAEVSMETSSEFADFVQQFQPEAIFVGEDWRSTPRWRRLGSELLARGIKVHFLPRAANISSTHIKQALLGQ